MEEFKQEEDLKTATRFIEKNIGKYHETAVGWYFFKGLPYKPYLSLLELV